MRCEWSIALAVLRRIESDGAYANLVLHGELADWFAARHLIAHVSVSDESEYAAAVVVVETRGTEA